jgi:hypothetical protein
MRENRQPAALIGAIVLAGALAACGGGREPNANAKTDASASDCPGQVMQLIERGATTEVELTVTIDKTSSFDNVSSAFLTQLDAVAATAVGHGTALRVYVFGAAATGVVPVIDCPALRAHVGNAKVRAKFNQRVIDALKDQLRDRVKIQPNDVSASDIAGAFAAISETHPVASRRVVLMLSDARQTGTPESRVTADLSGDTVMMYGVGRGRGGHAVPTDKAQALASRWRDWLKTTAHVVEPVVSTQLYTGGLS